MRCKEQQNTLYYANMSFSIGIVGLPNVGKSTLFRALTKKAVPAENFPFCTIDPNVGVVGVPDERIGQLANISKSQKMIPTAIEFVDIAGLVKGAHQGEGLGNKFLSHIREVDAIAHVVRDFKDTDVTHVENRINPEDDERIISLELIMADLSTVEKRHKDTAAKAKSGDKFALQQLATLDKLLSALNDGKPARDVALSADELTHVRDLHLITIKPLINVVNVDESEANRLPAHANEIVVSAKIESELSELEPADAKTMMNDLGIQDSGLNKLIVASYEILNLITFFTSGPEETRAWTITRGAKAPQAAGKIHTDFEKGFIRAEVIGYKDFVASGGEIQARELGKARLEGKEYIVQDGDVCHFRFST